MKSEKRLTRDLREAAILLGVDEKHLRNHRQGNRIDLGGGEELRLLVIGHRILVPVAELERVTGSVVAS